MSRTIYDIKRREFIQETKLAYESLLCHYPERVPTCHPEFEIRYSRYPMEDTSEKLMESHGRIIEDALHVWLREEHRLGRLFEKERWRGFLEPVHIWDIEVYYQRLFVYEKYYFQVILVHEHYEPEQNGHHPVYFELRLYGWIDSERNTILEYDEEDVSDDHMMPTKRWEKGKNEAWYEAYDIRQAEIKRRTRRRWKTYKNRKRVYVEFLPEEENQM